MKQTSLTHLDPFDEPLFKQFLNPDHNVLNDILAIRIMRGNFTQSDAYRNRLALGEEAYLHYNFDTAASNGRILIVRRRYKAPSAVEPPIGFHFPADWFWCFSQIEDQEDTSPATEAAVKEVPDNIRKSLSILPGLEFVQIKRVNFFSYGNGKPKPLHQKPPVGIMFFKFHGGLGLCVTVNHK